MPFEIITLGILYLYILARNRSAASGFARLNITQMGVLNTRMLYWLQNATVKNKGSIMRKLLHLLPTRLLFTLTLLSWHFVNGHYTRLMSRMLFSMETFMKKFIYWLHLTSPIRPTLFKSIHCLYIILKYCLHIITVRHD